MKTYHKIFILGLTFGMFLSNGFGQNAATQFGDSGTLVGEINLSAVGANLLLDSESLLLGQPLKRRDIEAKLWLSLDLGADYVFPKEDFKIRVECEVVQLQSGTLIGSSQIIGFTIDRQHPEFIRKIDLLPAIQGNSADKVRIDNFDFQFLTSPADPGIIAFLENQIRLTARVERSFAVDVRYESNELMANPVIMDPLGPSPLTHRIQTFSWTPDNIDAFPNYEFQLLKLFNHDPLHKNDEDEIVAKIDWSKALSVETQSSRPSISLTIAGGSGFYAMRVRPIGNYHPGGPANHGNYGLWSAAPRDRESVVLHKNSLGPAYFFLVDPDENTNWIYNRVFTEGDQADHGVRVSEGISYATPSLRMAQNQVYNSTDSISLVTQSFSDFSGRTALTTLPVPDSGNLYSYRKRFVLNTSGGLYGPNDFDKTTTIQDPGKINDSGTAFSYYSDNNPDLTIPNAEGYAFQRTLFKTDGTNRVTEESGVGKRHALGAQSNDRGRTTRTFFGSPSDGELICLFGDEAPSNESVIKVITIDPNNVASVVYTSKEGNTIATGLETKYTDNLDSLSASAKTLKVQNLTDQNIFTQNKFISQRRLALGGVTDVRLGYRLNCNGDWPGCMSGDCPYGIRFHLTDYSNATTYTSQDFTCSDIIDDSLVMTLLGWTTQTLTPTLNLGLGPVITLPPGEYLFTKEVFLDLPENHLETKSDEFEASFRPLIDAIAILMDEIHNEEEYEAFDIKMQKLAMYFSQYNVNPVSTNPNWADSIRLALDLDVDFDIPEDFQLGFIANANKNEPAQLSIQTACCGSDTIAIGKPDLCIPCMKIDSLRNVTNVTNLDIQISEIVDNAFMKYLILHLFEQNISPLDTQQFMPGFSYKSMSFMITQMLTSKYYTGNSKKDGSSWYKAVEDSNGELVFAETNPDGLLVPVSGNMPTETIYKNNDWNYDCKELLNCWQTAVNMMMGMTAEDTVFIMRDFNERHGEDESDDFSDDEDNRDQSFGDAILGFIVSLKLRGFEKKEGGTSKERQESMVNLPNLFMQCAGYQFYEIIDGDAMKDGSSPVPPDYTPLLSGIPATNPSFLSYYSTLFPQPNSVDHGTYAPFLPNLSIHELTFPYILRPEWFFKYFVYNLSDDGSNSYIRDNTSSTATYRKILHQQKAMEIQFCYNMPDLDSCANPGLEMCFNPCRYDHMCWNSSQREQFYRMISGGPTDPGFDSILDSLVQDTAGIHCPGPDSLKTLALAELESIWQGVEYRRGDLRDRLVAQLDSACYEVIDCHVPGPCQITPQQIEMMLDKLLAEMRDSVIDVVKANVKLGLEGYPKCTEDLCNWFDSQNDCHVNKHLEYEWFRPCDQEKLNQLLYWYPHFILTPCPGCPSFTPISAKPAGCSAGDNFSQTLSIEPNN